MNSAVKPISIRRVDPDLPILAVTGSAELLIRAGTVVTIAGGEHAFDSDIVVAFANPVAGKDYGVRLDEAGLPVAEAIGRGIVEDPTVFAGFHFAASGNAVGRRGGDGVAAINPFSCWDHGFRPACPDPRGMTMVEAGGRRFWCDIHLLGINHLDDGTSCNDVEIADGRSLPQKPGGGRYDRLDCETARSIYAHHGKGLLGAEEFFAAAFGVVERASRSGRAEKTGEPDGFRFVSSHGLHDVTGTRWQWGTDGDPGDPRPSIFGGRWWSDGDAGSRHATLDYWPGSSSESISARGRSDHVNPV